MVASVTPPRERRRGYRRLIWAAAAGLLAGILAFSVLGHPDAVRSLRHKIAFWAG
jgi:hypothetical protein